MKRNSQSGRLETPKALPLFHGVEERVGERRNSDRSSIFTPSPRASLRSEGNVERAAVKLRNSQSGIALVITLILLSVITVMAVTFLVVSRQEGKQVDTMTSQTLSKEAAESGLQQAMAQVIANMQATQNGLNFGLFVSTNLTTNFYNNTAGLTDVSYYDASGNLLPSSAMQKMLNNLLVLPRAPVFITTNQATPFTDFRYYLDLNRNGVYDTNGAVVEVNPPAALPVTNFYVGDPEWIGILNHPDWRHSPSNYFIARYAFIALPIGNSLDINNIGNQAKWALASPASSMWQNGYFRNQGVGSWELNLAGFLHELNTNWDFTGVQYSYSPTSVNAMNQSSQGTCFDDATQILQYRYGTATGYGSLRSFQNLYAGNVLSVPYFANEFVDGYTHGPLMTNLIYNPAPLFPVTATLAKAPWLGDYSTNQYFSTQDLFNSVPYYQNSSANALTSFSNHLYSIARFPNFSVRNHTTANDYNRYTFYRMLSQISFGSAAEPAEYPYGSLLSPTLSANPNYASVYANTPRMNLNYVNINGTNATDFALWSPVQFFTNAADRMLRAYFPNPIGTNNGQAVYLSVTNIPIYPTNYYTPAVHRVLQLAANMYDASTNRAFDSNSPSAPFFPSVFRPILFNGLRATTNIYIAGYVEVSNRLDTTAPLDFRRSADLKNFTTKVVNNPANPTLVNVYGVPYVIGVKQGFPSFYRFSFSPVVTVSRKIDIMKTSASAAPGPGSWYTNIQYNLGISNVMAVDCWYPYTNIFYNRGIAFVVTNEVSVYFTNNVGASVIPINGPIGSTNFSVPALAPWPGSPGMDSNGLRALNRNSFKTPLYTNLVVVPDSVLQINPPGLVATTNYFGTNIQYQVYNNGNGYLVPKWGINITNRVRLMMIDTVSGRLIDYVQIAGSGMDQTLDLNADLMSNSPTMWNTNSFSGNNRTPVGIFNQISVSMGVGSTAGWVQLPLPPGESVPQEESGLRSFLAGNDGTTNKQVGFEAFTKYQKVFTFAVNDPLVHYTVGDLTDQNAAYPPPLNVGLAASNVLAGVMHVIQTNRYMPWGSTFGYPNNQDIRAGNEWAYKDPMVTCEDRFMFPTNKYPTVGWLGRVHRGTPWQTVYLKSSGVVSNDWISWTGDTNVVTTNYLNVGYLMTNGLLPPNLTLMNDSSVSMPQSDYVLMDLFTTAPNDNASKGQLSINQTGTAAWAAALDGLIVLTNKAVPGGTFTNVPMVIDPNNVVGGNAAGVGGTNVIPYLVKAITDFRTNYPGQVYSSLGQICAVPQLSLYSPYLNYPTNNLGVAQSTAANQGIDDAQYEWIPQQIMSLLRVGTPRYVIFAYGQSLKPAPHSIVTSGQYFGMCTNYQITGEVATRAVVRFDNFPVPGVKPGVQPRAVVESFNVLSPNQ